MADEAAREGVVEPAAPLRAEDARALRRLLQRALGRGFRLVVVEVAMPRVRKRIVEWLEGEVAGLDGALLDVKVGALAGENLWSELGERSKARGLDCERAVLALHGWQEAVHGRPDEQVGLYRQLNVQRDLFVRDLGCFWVMLIHPYGSRKLQDIAPDFCDFVSLWIRAPEEGMELGGNVERGWAGATASVFLGGGGREESSSALLGAAQEAIGAARYTDARDLLTRFELAEGGEEAEGWALRLCSELELRRGNLDAARRAAERALVWSEARDDDEQTAEALHHLGLVLHARGQFDEARAALERSLGIEHAFYEAEDHPNALATMHELARVLRDQGDFQGARQLFERTLALKEASPEDISVAATLHELASLMLEQGDPEGARHNLRRALEIGMERHKTELHPDIATTLHSLAMVQHAQGELDAARQQLERALEIEAKVFGTELHPSVAASLHGLALILSEQGDLDGARLDLERVLEILNEVFGTELHPDVARTLHSLAIVLELQGDRDGARSTYERALNIKTQVLGPDHHSTCITEVSLAQLLLEQGERERAEALLRHARPILAQAFGPSDAQVQRADALLKS